MFSPARIDYGLNAYVESVLIDHEGLATSFLVDHAIGPVVPRGPAPQALNDYATTPEETPVTVAVLANDKDGQDADDKEDDDDDEDDDDEDRKKGTNDDDEFDIDESTVDLDPHTNGIQSQRTTNAGLYSVNSSGIVTFSPTLNFFGNSSIQYTVRSRADEVSNVATLSIDVSNVNDAPVIKGPGSGPFNAIAGQPVTVTLSHVSVADPDNAAEDLLITVLSGTGYDISGDTFTPHADFSGTLTVEVEVGDGAATSTAYPLTFQVTKDNDRPKITGQHEVSTPEDQALEIVSDHLKVEDSDDEWPEDFTIQVGSGENYTVSGQTITPAGNFSGTLTVPVTVSDGESTSESYPLEVSVTPVNDPPVITGQQPDPLTGRANESFTIAIANIIFSDADHTASNDFTLRVLDGSNYTYSGNTVTPASGFSGPLTVNVAISDPSDSSEPYAFRVHLTANSAPVITGQTELTTGEDSPIAVAFSNLFVDDADNEYPTGFTLTLQPGTNYAVDGDVITPAQDFSGDLSVPVVVNDGVDDSEPFPLKVSVTNVNDAPVITGQVALAVAENESIALDVSHLVIDDPDNETFSLSILSGDYTVSGNLVTPPAGFTGELRVSVFVSDGTENSNTFELIINVTPVNDPPRITGQREIVINEGSPVTLSLADVTVEDPDNTAEAFSLVVQPGTDYAVSGTTVTPSADFSGQLLVSVVVNDGNSSSEPYSLLVTVMPVNDPPVITGQAVISIDEDTPRTIDFADLVVSDPDNSYPSGFSLTVAPGEHYTLSGNTILPEADYSGPLTAQVQVSDGTLLSDPYQLTMTIAPVNDKPVITGQVPLETAEDSPVTILLSHLTVFDIDNSYPAGFTLTVAPGTNYSVSGTTVTPASDFNGTLNVSVSVSDGTAGSDPFIFQIQVGNANDAPLITGQASVSTSEETPFTLSLGHLTVSDPDNPFPTGFTLLVSPGTNYAVSGETITPAINFAGTLTIPVRVNDGVNNSPTFDFKLQVDQINDPPSFAPIANQQLAENTPAGSVTITGISKGPMEDDQQLTFVASSSDVAIVSDPVVQYNGTGATAVLSYIIKPYASGTATITVVAIDNGSSIAPNQNSYTSSFQVSVTDVNTPPTLDVINNITIMEDAEQQNVALTGIGPGQGEEQTLTVSVTTNKPEFFDMLTAAYTSPSPTGLLQFKSKANISGTAEISVTVADNGSGVAPHVNSITRSFSVIIQPVNDPPYFTSTPATVAVVQEQYAYSVGATDPDGEKVTITAPVKPDWLTLSNPGNNGQAMLSGKPPVGVLGEVSVTLQIKDGSSAVEQSFKIYVNVRPDVASLSLATEEDTPARLTSSFFNSGYTDDNENSMRAVTITNLPASGALLLNDLQVKAGDTIATESLSQLTYLPVENFYGTDGFGWNAFDGYHFGLTGAKVNISVLSVNDAPRVVLHEDTLMYEVNGESAFLASLVDIVDPDDDTLSRASVAFHPASYRLNADLLEFQTSGNIRGTFDFQSGVLQFTGVASLSEYRSALRSVRYLHQNTLDPVLEPKRVTFSLNDGEAESEGQDKVIVLQYTFVEFEIPTGFTPNGDQANDTWIIDRPGGGLEEMTEAVISVYTKQGVLVYRSKGFTDPWDGTMNGELLPADTYFYTIDLQLRNRKTYKGIVTILR